MKSRLRSLDSKISFFAFADIITSVCGVLIFVSLLLATDLGRPTDVRGESADSDLEQKLNEILAEQAEADLQNQRLQELFTTADTAPDPQKLQADISKLQQQLADEQRKLDAIKHQRSQSETAILARDQALGLTDLKNNIERTIQEASTISAEENKARQEMAHLEQQTEQMQGQLLKLRQRDGQIWLIPDKNGTTKEPILVTVAAAGAKIEMFDHPDKGRQFDKSSADGGLKSYLRDASPLNQYVVFLVRPSGIKLFEDLVETVRRMKFDVGFDALEEDREVHFSTPPPLDEPVIPATSPPPPPPGKATTASNTPPSPDTASSNAPPQPIKTAQGRTGNVPTSKSWWQKLLTAIGL